MFAPNHNEDKPCKSGKPIKSNITDNESAKMKTAYGVIQGYDGLAVVDDEDVGTIPKC